MALVAEPLQLIAQGGEGRVVAGGQAGQRDLLIAGVVTGADAVVGAQVAASVADGTVDIARLAEAAAPDTAPEQLQRHSVLHDLRAGDDGLDGEIGLVHVVDDALCDFSGRAVLRSDGGHRAVLVVRDIVQAGDVHAVQLGGGPEELRLAPALPAGGAVQLHQLHRQVLPLPQAHQVDEIGDGLGVIHGRAAGDDQRGQPGALRGMERDMGQVQHIQNGGEGHLVAHGEGHDVKIRDGVAGFQREQGHIRTAQLLLHIAPGGEHALTPHAVHLVHHAVENTHTQVGHTDLVGVREAEGNTGVHRRLILQNGVIFAAHVAGGLLHPGQDAFQSFIHVVSLGHLS